MTRRHICREPFAQDRLDRAGLEQAFRGGLLGEGIGNCDLDGGHGIHSEDAIDNTPKTRRVAYSGPAASPWQP